MGTVRGAAVNLIALLIGVGCALISTIQVIEFEQNLAAAEATDALFATRTKTLRFSSIPTT